MRQSFAHKYLHIPDRSKWLAIRTMIGVAAKLASASSNKLPISSHRLVELLKMGKAGGL